MRKLRFPLSRGSQSCRTCQISYRQDDQNQVVWTSPSEELGLGEEPGRERQAEGAPRAVVWEESAVSHRGAARACVEGLGCELWQRNGLRPEEPHARAGHDEGQNLPKRFPARLLTLYDINHVSPSRHHPQDALYTTKFVKGKRRGWNNPWAYLQVLVVQRRSISRVRGNGDL